MIDLPGGVSVTGEFLSALGTTVTREHYRLETRPDIFNEPPEFSRFSKNK